MSVIGSATLRLLGDTAQFKAELEGASAHWAKVGGQMEKAGKKLTAGITLPLIGAGTAISAVGMNFETEMSKIVGLVGISQDQVAEWSDQLLRLGPEVGKSPRELAEALFFVTSAGFRGAEAIEVLTISAKASAAGLGETATIADALTSAINAYGIENLSASSAANILTAAVREGKLEASALAPVLGEVLPTASALGVSFEDVAGTLAVFSRTGVGAAKGATTLNAIFGSLLKTSKEGADALDSVGLSLEELRNEAAGPGGVIGAMRTLDAAFKGNDEQIIQVIPSIEAFRGVMNALAQNADTVDSVMGGVANSAGALGNAFDAAADTARFKLDASLSEVMGSLVKLSATVLPPVVMLISIVADLVSDLAGAFSELPGPVRSTTAVVIGLVAAVGPLLLIAGKLIQAWGLLTGAFTFLAPAIGLIFTPITIAVAAFAALVVAGVLVYKNWEFLKAKAVELWDWIKGAFSLGVEFVEFLIDDFTAGVKDRFAWLTNILVGHSIVPDMMALIGKEFKGLDKLMVAPAEEATRAVSEAFASITNPAKIKGIDYKVSIDAGELYGAVIKATGSASVAFNALSNQIAPTAALFLLLDKEIQEETAARKSYVDVVKDLQTAEDDLNYALVSATESAARLSTNLLVTGTETMKYKDYVELAGKQAKIFGDDLLLVGNEQVVISERSKVALEQQRVALQESVDALRVQRIVTDTLSMATDQTAFKFENLQRSTAGIISDFSPLGMLATVLGSALEALQPAFDALQAPLKILGVILASAIMPILKALFPVIKFLSIAASYVVEGFLWLAGISLKVSGWLMNAIGTFVHGLGKILSKIPFIGGLFKPMKAAGKAMMDAGTAQMDAGEGMLDAIDDVRAGREEIRALEWPDEANEAAKAQVSATEGTTSAVEVTNEAVADVGSQLVELANSLLDATLSIRDHLIAGVDYLSAIAGPGSYAASTASMVATSGPMLALEGGSGGPSIGSISFDVQISGSDNPREAGREMADGFMETISGRSYNKTRRMITGSGKIEREI
jgi:TP901 family phage tail tape measure protein